MTLVGKIFVVAILVMSVVYMGFAMAVYSTHVNWKEVVERPRNEAIGGKPLGLKYQLEDARAEQEKLKARIEQLDVELTSQIVSLQMQLAKAESERNDLLAKRAEKQAELDQLVQRNREATAAVDTFAANLRTVTEENAGLREDLRKVQTERSEIFNEVVALTDQVAGLQGEVVRLKERNQQLTGQLSSWAQVFRAKQIDPEAELAGAVPPLDGVVTAVRADKMIEVSLGSDDGLRVGHTVDIFRGQSYLGRAQIVKTSPARAVGKLDPKLQKGPVQKDDRVATRLNG